MAFGIEVLNAVILLLVVANLTQDVAAMDGCNGTYKNGGVWKPSIFSQNIWKCGDQCM